MIRVSTDGVPASLPLAAAGTLLLARVLPLRFEYVPDGLGIVSRATLDRYPVQQETFWALFAFAVASVLTWACARALRARGLSVAALVAAEALATVAFAVHLWLPPGLATALSAAAAAGAWLVVRGFSSPPDAGASPADAPRSAPGRGRALRTAGFTAAVLVVAVGVTADFPVRVWSVAAGVTDDQLARGGWVFQVEVGQHLAWADALWDGKLHGRDFFCLYGPLYDLGIAGFWTLFGRSIAALELYQGLTRVLGFAALLVLGGIVLRRRAFAFLLPLLVPWIELRIGLALFGLAFLFACLRTDRTVLAAAAGGLAGISLLYSQEFGLAFAFTAALGFAVRGVARPAAAFAGALSLALVPLLSWYAAQGALSPMLRDLLAYPGYLLAGYGALPFPSLPHALPLPWTVAATQDALALRVGYGAAAICLGGALLALPVSALDLRHPLASARALRVALRRDPERLTWVLLAVFGLLCFRSALGRSDAVHMLKILPAPALLLVLAIERLYAQGRAQPRRAPLLGWRALALALLAWQAALLVAPRPLYELRRSVETTASLLSRVYLPAGDRHTLRVARYVENHTDPGDPVLFLPNGAVYYYLTDRPSPIRFVLGHQIVTDAHRREVLRDLRARPPRLVVWDPASPRVDDIPHEMAIGREIVEWIDGHYETVARFGAVEIRAPRGREGA